MLTLKQITSMLARMGFQVPRTSSFIITMFTLKNIRRIFLQTCFLGSRLISLTGRILSFRCSFSVFMLMKFQIRSSSCFRISIVSLNTSDKCVHKYTHLQAIICTNQLTVNMLHNQDDQKRWSVLN